MPFDISEELKKLPDRPGVYIMHDNRDAIIYIGKAVSLRKRVHQYFQPSHHEGIKKDRMAAAIERFEYIVTDSELEALVLECNLIKEHRPKYNTMLTDDKTYPYIKVTMAEDFPRVLFSRDMKKDKSLYFGPYTSAGAVKDTIDLLHKLYKIRTCNRKLPADIGKERACLNYHIHQCEAPCQGFISSEEYKKNIEGALGFLNGKYEPILNMLKDKMTEASDALEFEKAMEYRELLTAVSSIAQKQKISNSDCEDRDIIALAKDEEDAVVQIFFIRDGRMIGRDHFFLHIVNEDSSEELLTSFIEQFYGGTPYIPKEIMVQFEPDEESLELFENWLSQKKGQKVKIITPKRGLKEKLVELAEQNAKIVLTQDKERIKREEGRTIGAVKELAELLSLPAGKVKRLEAYDISNTNGFESVGSMVVYEKGKPKRSDYRKFKLRTIEGPNDYGSMKEVLTRRFEHGLRELSEQETLGDDAPVGKFSDFPDVILMDGGRGQVNIALSVLDELKIDIPVCGMVKDDHHRTRGLYFNNVEIPIDRSSEAFKLITRIQDEAHRFAIEFHRSLRSKDQVHSVLDDIPGIGPTRRKALMGAFESIADIKEASEERLAEIPSMDKKSAEAVYRFFHS